MKWPLVLAGARRARERRREEEETRAQSEGGQGDGASAANGTETSSAGSAPRRRTRNEEPTALMVGGVMLVIVAILAAGFALAQPAKAALGHVLLGRAWDRAQEDGLARAPWPWADMRPIAELRFPTLEARRIVLDAATPEALAWSPGIVRGGAALGAPGLSVIAAHQDTHFSLLADLDVGDAVEVRGLDGATLRYTVFERRILDARTFRVRRDPHGPDVLALSTCWPLDAGPAAHERLVVFASRVDA